MHSSTVSLPKASRTIIIPSVSSNSEDVLKKYKDSYTSIFKTDKERKTIFLECQSLKDSINLFTELSNNNIDCRYANYRMFIKITSDTTLHDYNGFKSLIKDKILEITENINILYFKLYQRDNRLTGNGYIVVDKYEDLKKLIRTNYFCEESKVSFQLLNFVKKEQTKTINN